MICSLEHIEVCGGKKIARIRLNVSISVLVDNNVDNNVDNIFPHLLGKDEIIIIKTLLDKYI